MGTFCERQRLGCSFFHVFSCSAMASASCLQQSLHQVMYSAAVVLVKGIIKCHADAKAVHCHCQRKWPWCARRDEPLPGLGLANLLGASWVCDGCSAMLISSGFAQRQTVACLWCHEDCIEQEKQGIHWPGLVGWVDIWKQWLMMWVPQPTTFGTAYFKRHNPRYPLGVWQSWTSHVQVGWTLCLAGWPPKWKNGSTMCVFVT